MRTLVVVSLLALASTALAVAPVGSAAAYCVTDHVKNTSARCEGVVCWGHSGGRWQKCLPGPIACPHDMPCECTCPPLMVIP